MNNFDPAYKALPVEWPLRNADKYINSCQHYLEIGMLMRPNKVFLKFCRRDEFRFGYHGNSADNCIVHSKLVSENC